MLPNTRSFYIFFLCFFLNSFLSLILSTNAIAEKNKLNLLLPTVYQAAKFNDNTKQKINHYWISEKYDGIRAHWTGTQLLTKQGHLIYPPQAFTKDWPSTALDGELWLGRNQFDQVSSIVRKALSPNKEVDSKAWERINFMVFDLPNNKGNFTERLYAMQQLISPLGHTSLKVIPQEKVSSLNLLQKKLNDVIKNYGEGLMLHHQEALYFAGRSKFLLKLKKHLDAEAKVISYIPGKGKYSGMLGSLLVETPEGLRFKIGSGFTDKQRMTPPEIGCIITYKYFGKTSKGLPRFASFIRIRHPKNLIAAHLKE